MDETMDDLDLLEDEAPALSPSPPPPDTMVIKLRTPLQPKDGDPILELNLREPTAGEVLLAEIALGDMTGIRVGRMYQAKLLALISSVPEDLLDRLHSGAFMEACRYLDAWVKRFEVKPEISDPSMLSRDGLLITLPAAVSAMGHECTELQLEELTMAQLKKAEASLGDYSAAKIRGYKTALVAFSSGFPRPLIEKLPVSIVNKAAAYVQSFTLPPAQATGG